MYSHAALTHASLSVERRTFSVGEFAVFSTASVFSVKFYFALWFFDISKQKFLKFLLKLVRIWFNYLVRMDFQSCFGFLSCETAHFNEKLVAFLSFGMKNAAAAMWVKLVYWWSSLSHAHNYRTKLAMRVHGNCITPGDKLYYFTYTI